MEYIKSKIRDVYDFPKPGIIFRDLTTMFKDPRAMHIVGWDLAQLYRDKGVKKLVASSHDLHKLHRRAKRIERSQKPPRRCRCKIAYRLLKQKDNPFG